MDSHFLFGTVGSPLSTPKKPGGSVGAIEQLHNLGLNALELGWVQSVRVKEETCMAIEDMAERHQVKISVHAPYFINLNADDEEWPKSRKRLMDAAFFGNLAGATDIVFHPGSLFSRPPEEVLPIAVKRLGDCKKELEDSRNPVVLRPETMGKIAMLGSLTDTLVMAREISGVIPCLDFAHLHAAPGDGTINSKAEFGQILETYRDYLGPQSLQNLHIHLSGIEYGPKGEKNHVPIRESDLKLDELFEALREYNCGGRILCESPVMEDDAIILRDLWESMGK